jgi:hypothetical protein
MITARHRFDKLFPASESCAPVRFARTALGIPARLGFDESESELETQPVKNAGPGAEGSRKDTPSCYGSSM